VGTLHLQVQVLGLLAVLALPDAELPPEVAAGSHDILAAIVKLLSAYRDQQVRATLLLCRRLQPQCLWCQLACGFGSVPSRLQCACVHVHSVF
jgi:hypothetical protein